MSVFRWDEVYAAERGMDFHGEPISKAEAQAVIEAAEPEPEPEAELEAEI